MRLRLSLLALALAASPLAAVAERPPRYFALNGGTYDFDGPLDTDGETVSLKLGYEFSPFLAAEAHVGIATGADRVGGVDPDVRQVAAFARFNLPFERTDVYALAGAGRVSFNDGSGRDDFTGPAAGLGIELFGSDRSAVALEFVRYEDSGDDDHDHKIVTLGWKRHFDWPAFR